MKETYADMNLSETFILRARQTFPGPGLGLGCLLAQQEGYVFFNSFMKYF